MIGEVWIISSIFRSQIACVIDERPEDMVGILMKLPTDELVSLFSVIIPSMDDIICGKVAIQQVSCITMCISCPTQVLFVERIFCIS